ncbi:MAG: lysophospholipid acyltransferase family protein [Chthoniobacteraceae bacterium]
MNIEDRTKGRLSLYQLRAFQAAGALARILPRSILLRIAVLVGRAASARNPAGRDALRENLRVITGKTGDALETLCADNVAHFSRMLADYFRCGTGDPSRANELLHEWRGFEHFESARARGKGIVLVTGHLGNWELGGTLLALRGLPLTVITLEEPSTELTRWRDEMRQRIGIKTITVGPGHDFAFVEMMNVLRRNEILAMLVDRPYAGTGATVNFCGRDTQFSTAPALLWQHTDAAVIPAFVLQESGGRYISFADAPLDFHPGAGKREALIENTQRLATHFEDIIRKHPEQWFNYVPIWNSESSSSSRSLRRD